MKRLKFFIEAIILHLFYGMLRLIPLQASSALGGWLGRTLGMRIKRTRIAAAQMAAHLPPHSEAEREEMLQQMWDHLGRVIAEYTHLARGALDSHVTIEGAEQVQRVIASGKPALFISGHFGHWELAPKSIAMCGLPLHLVYRPPNNPLADGIIHRIRSAYTIGHYGKGADGARGVLGAIRRGESIGMLIDQKDNTGASIPFLGAPAMTMLSAAKLALKYNLPVIPVRAERTAGTEFHVTIYPPLTPPDASLQGEAREIAYMTTMNEVISSWIREKPSQWFWLHRRWPKA